uniref:Uncharacterized protein n=1 Tax=Aegilops tauschii TaxID=37682 RepID=R7W4W8_AEGTA
MALHGLDGKKLIVEMAKIHTRDSSATRNIVLGKIKPQGKKDQGILAHKGTATHHLFPYSTDHNPKKSAACQGSGRLGFVTALEIAAPVWRTIFHALLTRSIGCNWLYSCTKRSSMRAQYNFQGSPYMDCFVHMCCESCALCQEYKQLENRGFNMSKGWEGSNKITEGMAAPEKQGMDVLLDHE